MACGAASLLPSKKRFDSWPQLHAIGVPGGQTDPARLFHRGDRSRPIRQVRNVVGLLVPTTARRADVGIIEDADARLRDDEETSGAHRAAALRAAGVE